MSFTFDKKLFIYLSLAFILFTIVGTLSHELGHYTAARFLGYQAEIHYNSTQTLTDIYICPHDPLWIRAGGPIQTIFFGSIGSIILFLNRKKYLLTVQLNLIQWLWIFLSLFWVRELFNFSIVILNFILTGSYSTHNDEISLATGLGIPELSISIAAATIAAFILCFIIYVVPRRQRFTFLCSLIFGAVAGFLFWMEFLGPIFLPVLN